MATNACDTCLHDEMQHVSPTLQGHDKRIEGHCIMPKCECKHFKAVVRRGSRVRS